jgi:phosphoglycolate phosphatase-like HAD superfamily hydrolase
MREFFPGCDPQQVQAFYEDHLLEFDRDIRIDESAATTLEKLRDADVLRGIVTNTPTDLARDILAWAGLIGIVDVTVGASSEIPPKPAPDLILGACRMLDVEPARALVVGDSPFDEQAAEAARVRFVGFRMSKDGSVAALPDVARLVLEGDGT